MSEAESSRVLQSRMWLKAEREALGWSPATLAKKAQPLADQSGYDIKLSQQGIWNFENNGKRVPGWFRFAKDAITFSKAGTYDRYMPDQIDDTRVEEDIVQVRQVDIRYAMGDGAVIEDYPATGLVPFNRQFLRTLTRADTDRLFIARGSGDSMMPTLINDDLVLVDTSKQRISEQDRIWAIVVGGAGMIKRVRRLPRDQYEIISDNPIIRSQVVDHDDLHIVGRVVWIGRQV